MNSTYCKLGIDIPVKEPGYNYSLDIVHIPVLLDEDFRINSSFLCFCEKNYCFYANTKQEIILFYWEKSFYGENNF